MWSSGLPLELWELVFLLCDFRSCGRLEAASRCLRDTVQGRSLWKVMLRRRFTLTHRDVLLAQRVSWAGVYIQKELVLENFARGRCRERVLSSEARVGQVAVLSDASVVAGGYGVSLWRAGGRGASVRSSGGARGFVRCLQADQWKVVTGASDREVRVWSTGTLECRAVLQEHDGPISALQYQDVRLATGSFDSTAKTWDLTTGASLLTLQPGHGGPVVCLQLDHARSRLLTGGHDRAVRCWDLRTAECLATLGGHAGVADFVAALDDDWTVLTRGRADPAALLWDLRQPEEPVGRLGGAGAAAAPTTCVRLLGDGVRALTGHRDASVRVWDVRRGVCEQELHAAAPGLAVLALDADDKKVAAGGADGVVRTWTRGSTDSTATRRMDGPVRACELRGGVVVAATTDSVRLLDFSSPCLLSRSRRASGSCALPTSWFAPSPGVRSCFSS